MNGTSDILQKYISEALADANFGIFESNGDKRYFATPVTEQSANKIYYLEEFLDGLYTLRRAAEGALRICKKLQLKEVLDARNDEEKDIYFPVIYVSPLGTEEADEHADRQVVICPTKSVAEALGSKNNLFLTLDEIRTCGIFIMSPYTI